MRRKKLLLAATALAGCSKGKEPEPLPGNPKGTKYDAAQIDAELTMPANPKGSFYDGGMADDPPPPPPRDAGPTPDAAKTKPTKKNPSTNP
jgi:hypothetical protein